MIFGGEQELPCHSAGQLLFWQKCVHEKLRFALVNLETNLEKYGAFLYNNVCTHTDLPERMKPMADTHIKYNDHSINSAFKNHYIVPDYQREYVWKDEQVEQLLADLLDAYNTDSQKAYFLGTIVTYDSGSQFELIDGQQRLTTFFILLCAIKKIYMDHGEQTSVIENLIYSPTMNSEGDVINLYHLQLQYEDAGNCLELIEKGQERPNYITQSVEDLEQFIQRARRYTDLTELTPYALRELVKAVYVEAPDKSSGKRKQRVHIEYDLVGYIPVDELIKAEQA
ncbi:MAG TPA: DUF262 domain-containing protein [Candidatus Enterenecus merdae]|nr:DUF262 domain-containing protein [Candidatus Enterenecus merdae]